MTQGTVAAKIDTTPIDILILISTHSPPMMVRRG